MQHEPVVYALVKLHAELGGKIQDNKREAARLRENMKHVEAVLKLIQPGIDTRKIAVRRRYNANPLYKRGHIFRAVLETLRAAPEPLTVDQISDALFAAKGVSEPTRDQRRHMYGAVNSSLGNNEGKSVTGDTARPRHWSLCKER